MRRAALLALLWTGVASAQPMMDPTQLSGIPRPDPAVPAGMLTVKVLHGELSAIAKPGTPVHLVGLSSDGTVSHVRGEVKDDGHAVFEGLSTDSGAAYYVLALLGDDRRLSEAVILPAKMGVRMIISGRKRDAAGAPQGAPIDDESKAHEGVDKAPALPAAGEIEVTVRGRIEPGVKVTLRDLADGSKREAQAQPVKDVDDALLAKFSGLPTGGEHVYLAEVASGGRSYLSSPALLSATAGVRRMILVYDRLLFAMQGGAQLEDEVLWFELQMTVANVSGAPVREPGGLALPLPLGYRSAKIADEESPFVLQDGIGPVRHGAVPPGQLNATVQFAMPIENGRVSVDMPAPLGMFQSQIAIQRVGGAVVTLADGTTPRLSRADDGREYYLLDGFSVPPGDSLRFTVAGLPMASGWQPWARGLAGLLVVLMVAAAVAVAVRRPRRAAGRPADPAIARRELGQRRERLFAELVALERLRASQRIDASEFDAQRRAIMTKLVLVHRELDELDAPPAS